MSAAWNHGGAARATLDEEIPMAASLERFGQYAAAFEQAFESDDWSVLEPYFTEDAVYESSASPSLAIRRTYCCGELNVGGSISSPCEIRYSP